MAGGMVTGAKAAGSGAESGGAVVWPPASRRTTLSLASHNVWMLLTALMVGVMVGEVRGQSGAVKVAIPTPEQVLGFVPGADRRLATWDQLTGYYRQLDALSDRMMMEEIGRTTLRRPFVVLTISSPENLRRLDELRDVQRRLSDPRQLTGSRPEEVEELIRRGRTVVLITCGIHATEVGGAMTATGLAHRLLTENSPEVSRILDEVVLLLVPSLNPDGTDIVTDWYRRTLGTPAEGSSPPQLYHHYTGHDNNRDWYAFTQVETQLTVDKVLNVWRPQIWHDIHQMGASGARMFVPPYLEPWEPNIDPAIIAGVNSLGAAMAWDLTSSGRAGVLVSGIYDAWTPARAYSHYHAGLRILSETAAAKLATPIEMAFDRLMAGPNYDPRRRSWNFPYPWPGGKWTLGDVVDYQSAGAMSLLGQAARQREGYLRNFLAISRRAVEARGGPFAFILPEPALPDSLNVAITQLKADLKDVSGSGNEKHERSEQLVGAATSQPSTSEEVRYYYQTEGLDRLLAILRRGGVEVVRATEPFVAGGRNWPAGTHVVPMRQPYGAFAKTLLEVQRYPDLREYPGGPPKAPYDVTAHTLPLLFGIEAVAIAEPFELRSRPEPSSLVIQSRVRSAGEVRVGLYRSFRASMDEGWTRWVFDQYRFEYSSVLDGEIRDGQLRSRYDAIIIPDQPSQAIQSGLSAGVYPKEYAGGLGEAGISSLRRFVEEGGTLVTFNQASLFAIDQLQLPVRNLLKGVDEDKFYCPGSILRLEVDRSNRLTFGLGAESIAWFEEGPAFEVTDPARARVVASYPEKGEVLLSGWILGEQRLRGRAALVEVALGRGRVILFGFRPQYRGQSLATYPLLFNALMTSK